MKEENRAFGFEVENADKAASEDKFDFHKDTKMNIEASAKELIDFFDMVSKDAPEPSEEEICSGVEKILAKTHPEEENDSQPVKTSKSKKVTFRVLFVAALLSLISFSCLFVMGTKHNINIENGFVTFAKDTVKIVFFGDEELKLIHIETLLEDLSLHGYEDVLIPKALHHFKSTVPEYSDEYEVLEFDSYVTFKLYNEDVYYGVKIQKIKSIETHEVYFKNLDNAETLVIDDVYIYVFEYENGLSSIRFANDGYAYYLVSEVSLPEMMSIAETIIKMEE